MKNCQSCGFENADESKFCQKCGEKFEETKIQKFCTNCGKEIEKGAVYCANCGTLLQPANVEKEEASTDMKEGVPKQNTKKIILIVVAFIVIVIVVLGALWFIRSGNNENEKEDDIITTEWPESFGEETDETISDAGLKNVESDSQSASTEVKIDATEWPATFGAQTDEVLIQVIVDAPDGYVNLRSGAGTDYEVIEPISNGEVLDVYVETDTYKWCGVKYGKNYGWVSLSQVSYIYEMSNGEPIYVKQRIYTQEELNSIKEQLGVPAELEATFKIGRTSYWEAAESAITPVDISTENGYAGAFILDDATLGRNIFTYQEN